MNLAIGGNAAAGVGSRREPERGLLPGALSVSSPVPADRAIRPPGNRQHGGAATARAWTLRNDRRDTRLLLLRHAETAQPDRFHGVESDVELGPRGRKQAELIARLIAGQRPAAVYCSAMRRACQTAEAIGSECGLAWQPIEALHERRMGALSGVPREQGWGAYAEAMERWRSGDLDFTHEGGESYAAIRDRVVAPLLGLLEAHRGQTIVVVAHGVVIRVALTTLLEGYTAADFERIEIHPAALNDLRWDGSTLRAVTLNLVPPAFAAV